MSGLISLSVQLFITEKQEVSCATVCLVRVMSTSSPVIYHLSFAVTEILFWPLHPADAEVHVQYICFSATKDEGVVGAGATHPHREAFSFSFHLDSQEGTICALECTRFCLVSISNRLNRKNAFFRCVFQVLSFNVLRCTLIIYYFE